MIPNLAQFCQGWFHCDEVHEWKEEEYCLCVHPHTRNIVRGLVLLENDQEQTLYAETYHNVFLGHAERNLHVEDVMVNDEKLLKALKRPTQGQKHLTLYMTYQPCHFSTGGRDVPKVRSKSCASTLSHWVRQVITPLGIDFQIRICSLYRAHWTDPSLFSNDQDITLFEGKTAQARHGLKIIQDEPQINLQAMTRKDWQKLGQFCKNSFFAEISEGQWQYRYAYDQKIANFLKTFALRAQNKIEP